MRPLLPRIVLTEQAGPPAHRDHKTGPEMYERMFSENHVLYNYLDNFALITVMQEQSSETLWKP